MIWFGGGGGYALIFRRFRVAPWFLHPHPPKIGSPLLMISPMTKLLVFLSFFAFLLTLFFLSFSLFCPPFPVLPPPPKPTPLRLRDRAPEQRKTTLKERATNAATVALLLSASECQNGPLLTADRYREGSIPYCDDCLPPLNSLVKCPAFGTARAT